ncbi:nitroreductase family protein [[Clostridium] fimetarium]|uniref:Nitroreductase n=1 Tax=[Clostridium] fimetarium TaxID=99656 RepID=A0A1I0NGK2_9FIRM|nr:nitroreductase family protein [[Clostridium] fimetarium]SEW00289.1 Nitroreductase [[Clostridium] fimetarium]
MDYDEIIKTRYSVRKYSEEPVEQDKLNKILQAGRIAPTAGNRQPQRIIVIENEEAFEKIKQCTPCHFNAPLLLLVCYDKSVENNNHYGDKRPYGQVDASIVLTHMMLEAQNLELGTVWVGLFNPALLREYFHIPNNYEILGLMPIGYPDMDAIPSKMHSEKFLIDHTVFYNSF